MSQLYWACREPTVAALLDLAASFGRAAKIAGKGNSQPVIEIDDPDAHLLRETARLILLHQLIGAAVVKGPLASSELFIAAEWMGKLVVARTELGLVEPIGSWLRHDRDFAPRDLVIFNLVEGAEPEDLGPIDAKPVAVAAILENPSAYYGRFADPNVGGANALFAAGVEAANHRGLPDGQVLVGTPETFGFSVDSGGSSVVSWTTKGFIAVRAFGFSLGQWEEVVGEIEGFGPDDLDRGTLAQQVERWSRQDLRFGLAIMLRGEEDPPVVIPMGSVYQNPAMGSKVQNLAVAQAHQVTVGLARACPWCCRPGA